MNTKIEHINLSNQHETNHQPLVEVEKLRKSGWMITIHYAPNGQHNLLCKVGCVINRFNIAMNDDDYGKATDRDNICSVMVKSSLGKLICCRLNTAKLFHSFLKFQYHHRHIHADSSSIVNPSKGSGVGVSVAVAAGSGVFVGIAGARPLLFALGLQRAPAAQLLSMRVLLQQEALPQGRALSVVVWSLPVARWLLMAVADDIHISHRVFLFSYCKPLLAGWPTAVTIKNIVQ